jgi:hypothetical protein
MGEIPVRNRSSTPIKRLKQTHNAARLIPLVEQVAIGRQEALAELYDETASALNGLLSRMLEHREDAEEVLLDVYII